MVRRVVAATAIVGLCALAVAVGFAGSAETLASGVRVAGVDVGGLTPGAARRELQRRAAAMQHRPVVFTAGRRTWSVEPAELGVQEDWAAAVETAREAGDGFAPVRGVRRLRARVFGSDISPATRVWHRALALEVRRIAAETDRPHRDASVRLRGLHPVVVSERAGHLLDRDAAAATIVRALASFARDPVSLPVRADEPRVVAADLPPAVAATRRALSARVRLALGRTRWVVPRWRLARMLALPRDGVRNVAVGGRYAERYFARLAKRVGRPPRNADFAVSSHGVRVIPDRDGLVVDLDTTRRALLRAATEPGRRIAPITVVRKSASRSTAEARAMGIRGLVASYETIYGGDPNRIHNVQLVSHLIDHTLIAPGATFSFNATTGERTADKGFREAPVIINGELQTGLGGGVCQVSTTVYNAAYEAGLDITERTNHALYISHYPLARDATVNYPDTDLKFVNDTPHWLLLRTFVGPWSLVVSLYGTAVHRRVESRPTPLVATGPVPVKEVPDADLYVGQSVTDSVGAPPRSTSVRRLVYSPSGKLLHDDSWSSYYRGEASVVRVGTKPRPKPKPAPPPPPKATTTPETTPTETTPSETTPTTSRGEGAGATTATSTTSPTPSDTTTTPSPPAAPQQHATPRATRP
jgi:vancomycin resistance protein YoaR